MARAVIAYDKDLPEIPGRRPWEEPTSFLVKDDAALTGWREDTSGRRPSRLLLVPKIRAAVDAWRERGYSGASDVTRRLFEYWFDEDRELAGFPVPFRYYFCQREAIETLVWLVEIAGHRDVQELIQSHATLFHRDLLSKNIEFQTTMGGTRQIRRYVPELDGVGVQDLPPENLHRFAFKMATGSGKTWVIAMAVVWSHFHKKRVPGSEFSTNFLIIAPNVIVYQRLERDFASNNIFRHLPLVPPEWRPFEPKVILRGESTEPDASGNLFLTNIHQLYEFPAIRSGHRRTQWTRCWAGSRSKIWQLASAPCLSESSRSRTSWSSTTRPITSTTRTSLGASPCWRSTEPCPRASVCGSTSPPRPRTRMACTSLGQSATTRSPRRWRIVSSRHR